MADGFVHTIYNDGEWINEIEGGRAVGASYPSKDIAVAVGRAVARSHQTEHLIHNEDGTVSERKSYGNDPVARTG